MLVLQGLGACSVPSTQNSTATQSSSLEEPKQNGGGGGYSKHSQGLGLGLPLISPAQFAEMLNALTLAQRLLCRGFPQEKARGPRALVKFMHLLRDAQQQGVLCW